MRFLLKETENLVEQWQISFLTYVVIAFVVTVLFFLIMNKSKKKLPWWKYAVIFVFSVYLLVLYKGYLGIFGFRLSEDRFSPNLIPLKDIIEIYPMGLNRMMEQIVLNIVSFIPWGLFLPVMHDKVQKFSKVFGSAVGLAVAIEIVQYFIGGRVDIDDVILRGFGAAVGYVLFYLLRKGVNRK